MFAFLDWLSFNGLLKWAHDALVAAWDWVWNTLVAVSGAIWSAFSTAVSGVHAMFSYCYEHLGVVRPYFNYVNAWFPLDLFFTLVAIYSAFWLGLVVYRSIKKWIPTVSG